MIGFACFSIDHPPMAPVLSPPLKKLVIRSCLFLVLACLVIVQAAASPGIEFRVGGPRGWTEPNGNESENYNHWARRNRFHIGDALYFKYENDSVLVVDREDYGRCNTSNPLLKFMDGNTTFVFDRYGFFYFISGEPGHCLSGQKLIVRVMVHPEEAAGQPSASPTPTPTPFPGGPTAHGSASRSAFGPSASAQSSSSARVVTGLGVVVAAFVALVYSN